MQCNHCLGTPALTLSGFKRHAQHRITLSPPHSSGMASNLVTPPLPQKLRFPLLGVEKDWVLRMSPFFQLLYVSRTKKGH